jgi:hypothetical protein
MKMTAYELSALAPGSVLKHYTIVDLIAMDPQGFLYRAESSEDELPVMLYEFLPSSLAVRAQQGVQALHGKAEALAKAVSAYALRLRSAGCWTTSGKPKARCMRPGP